MRGVAKRPRIPFRAVNRRDRPDYDPGLQRHHLLPRQLLTWRCFGPMFETIGPQLVGFDDFRANGLLLPAEEDVAIRMDLPLHRGPHRQYNSLVIERVGQIERAWSELSRLGPEAALEQALMRLSLLQRTLRRRLLDPIGRRLRLHRADPVGKKVDFSELDAMADALWGDTEPVQAELAPSFPAYSSRAR